MSTKTVVGNPVRGGAAPTEAGIPRPFRKVEVFMRFKAQDLAVVIFPRVTWKRKVQEDCLGVPHTELNMDCLLHPNSECGPPSIDSVIGKTFRTNEIKELREQLNSFLDQIAGTPPDAEFEMCKDRLLATRQRLEEALDQVKKKLAEYPINA